MAETNQLYALKEERDSLQTVLDELRKILDVPDGFDLREWAKARVEVIENRKLEYKLLNDSYLTLCQELGTDENESPHTTAKRLKAENDKVNDLATRQHNIINEVRPAHDRLLRTLADVACILNKGELDLRKAAELVVFERDALKEKLEKLEAVKIFEKHMAAAAPPTITVTPALFRHAEAFRKEPSKGNTWRLATIVAYLIENLPK